MHGANIHMALNHPDQCKFFFQKTLDACVQFKAQSSYFSMHSHRIEALVGLAAINFEEDLVLAKTQLEEAKSIQDARGIFKFSGKIAKLQERIEGKGFAV